MQEIQEKNAAIKSSRRRNNLLLKHQINSWTGVILRPLPLGVLCC